MARSSWEYSHLSGYEFWEDYGDYKDVQQEDLGIGESAGFCWWDPQWWYDEWIDPIAVEYGFPDTEIRSFNIVTAYRYKTSIQRRKDKAGYIDWRSAEKNKEESSTDHKRRSKRVLRWAHASAENFSKYIRGYCGYSD